MQHFPSPQRVDAIATRPRHAGKPSWRRAVKQSWRLAIQRAIALGDADAAYRLTVGFVQRLRELGVL